MVTERLDCSPPTKVNRVKSPAEPLHIFASGNRARRCRWSAGFLGDLPFSPALAIQRCSIPTSSGVYASLAGVINGGDDGGARARQNTPKSERTRPLRRTPEGGLTDARACLRNLHHSEGHPPRHTLSSPLLLISSCRSASHGFCGVPRGAQQPLRPEPYNHGEADVGLRRTSLPLLARTHDVDGNLRRRPGRYFPWLSPALFRNVRLWPFSCIHQRPYVHILLRRRQPQEMTQNRARSGDGALVARASVTLIGSSRASRHDAGRRDPQARRSPPTTVIRGRSPAGSLQGFRAVGIVQNDAACRRAFSGSSRFPRPCIPAPLLPRVLFHVGSQLESPVLTSNPIHGVYTSRVGRKAAQCRDMEIDCVQPARSVYLTYGYIDLCRPAQRRKPDPATNWNGSRGGLGEEVPWLGGDGPTDKALLARRARILAVPALLGHKKNQYVLAQLTLTNNSLSLPSVFRFYWGIGGKPPNSATSPTRERPRADAIPQHILARAFHNFWCRLHTCLEGSATLCHLTMRAAKKKRAGEKNAMLVPPGNLDKRASYFPRLARSTLLRIENYVGLEKGKLLVPLAEGEVVGCIMYPYGEFGQWQCDVTSGMHFLRARSQFQLRSVPGKQRPRVGHDKASAGVSRLSPASYVARLIKVAWRSKGAPAYSGRLHGREPVDTMAARWLRARSTVVSSERRARPAKQTSSAARSRMGSAADVLFWTGSESPEACYADAPADSSRISRVTRRARYSSHLPTEDADEPLLSPAGATQRPSRIYLVPPRCSSVRATPSTSGQHQNTLPELVGSTPVGTPRPRSRSEGAIRATLTRTPSASSFLRARRAVFRRLQEPIRVKRGEYGVVLECKGGGNRESPEETCRVRQDSYMRKSGSDSAGNRSPLA
ncbi:hypothetical protein PR048_017614 [Dryococelus australis]|uniref:Uncharacterized protein n=1 Tax=Dryococelus australis TaxID=614101 RepID=A0ABQ9HA66_9NEOP|nr:hypothetical protein PR048_017614 [Dryococelus australis]